MSQENDWYGRWVRHHCDATAAGPEALKMLNLALPVLVGEWMASESELVECTHRLVAGSRVPKFSNEHSEAIGRELRDMRIERDRQSLERSGNEWGEVCVLCDNCGWVEVPHPQCIYHGDLSLHPQVHRVIVVSVTCSCAEGERQSRADSIRAEGVEAGKASKARRISLVEYTRLVRGADGPALLSRYRRKRIEAMRRDGFKPLVNFTSNAFKEVIDRIRRESEGEIDD